MNLENGDVLFAALFIIQAILFFSKKLQTKYRQCRFTGLQYIIVILSKYFVVFNHFKVKPILYYMYRNHSLMPHDNITNNDSTKVIFCFEQSQKIAGNSGSVSFQTSKFCRYIEETTLNRMSQCLIQKQKLVSAPLMYCRRSSFNSSLAGKDVLMICICRAFVQYQ